ncbi:glycine cleavage system aminomethyltransferase GcvT [Phytohabitans kaempferiae]|uniref:Aminomethyltransferase n=1 Tax=Phytohabitans kaempferiae TaxID=1620943 RepID=A0ABV6M3G7_9ACTN
MSRYTPLTELHEELGAWFTDFAGWSMPVRYGSEIAEHESVRERAGLFDLSHMGEIELTGPEAGASLDHAIVGHASKIGIGRARYSMLCADDGGVLDDLVIYRLADDRYLVVANAGNAAVVAAALQDRAAGFDTSVRDTSDEWALIAVQGPAAAAIVERLTSVDLSALRYYAITTGSLTGCEVLLARTGYTGEDGFEVYCRPGDAARIWAALTEAGSSDGLIPAGLACRDTLRLEAGMPLYGHELNPEVTPFEAGLGRLVAFDKPGDFVGRTALAQRRDEGARQVLAGLASAGRRAPRSGYTVIDPAGGVVGHVTSGAPSPTLGHPIAMAYVPVGLHEPGTKLLVDIRGKREAVVVVPMPFYRRP